MTCILANETDAMSDDKVFYYCNWKMYRIKMMVIM